MNPHATLEGAARMRSSRLSLPPPPALASELYWARDFLTRLPVPTTQLQLRASRFCGLRRRQPFWSSHVLCRALLALSGQESTRLLELPWQVGTGYWPATGYSHSWLVLLHKADPTEGCTWLLDLVPPETRSGPQLYSLPPSTIGGYHLPLHWATDLLVYEIADSVIPLRDRRVIAAEVKLCLAALTPNGRHR